MRVPVGHCGDSVLIKRPKPASAPSCSSTSLEDKMECVCVCVGMPVCVCVCGLSSHTVLVYKTGPEDRHLGFCSGARPRVKSTGESSPNFFPLSICPGLPHSLLVNEVWPCADKPSGWLAGCSGALPPSAVNSVSLLVALSPGGLLRSSTLFVCLFVVRCSLPFIFSFFFLLNLFPGERN